MRLRTLLMASVLAATLPAASALAQAPNTAQFHAEPVIDRTQGGLSAGAFMVPNGWKTTGGIQWNYANVTVPVRGAARIEAPDGSAWVESFPAEMFYWLEPRDTRTAIGGSSLGMIHWPGITIQDAMQRVVLARYRGRVQNPQILGVTPIPNLAQALNKPPVAGDSLAIRVRYLLDGKTVDEDFFGILGNVDRIPYHGPQGTTYENHRVLQYVHSMGAVNGQLPRMRPLLSAIYASFEPDPVWLAQRDRVMKQLSAQFDENLRRGYAQIAAAGALSRQISANNDAMIRQLDSQRAASNASRERTSKAFSQYIRGTETVKDPYYGTSEQSSANAYHWTDGVGSYQHSNDPNFDPNRTSNGNWQRMERTR